MNGARNGKLFLAPPPWALGRGQKVKYNLFSITKSISKIFIPNFVCVLTNERYKANQAGFLFCPLGHALGMGLKGGGGLRGQNQIPSCCLSVMLSPPKPLDESQPNLVCELLPWMGCGTANFLAPPPGALGRCQKVKYLILITTSISRIFIPKFVCVLTNERYKIYQTGFLFCCLGNAPGVGLWALGVPRWSKIYFSQTWSCGISNRRGWRAEQNVSKISILGSNWWPWGEVKGQISLNFGYHVNFKDFYTKLCVCSHKWKIQNISDDNAPGVGLWALGVPRWSKIYFSQTWSCGISNRRGWRAEQNVSKISILGSNWWPWGEVKGQISLNFGYHVNFKDFYTKLCVCSHKWKIQNISDEIFILSPG